MSLTMKIPLGRTEKFAVIDSDDWELVRGYAWSWAKPTKHKNGSGYAQASVRIDTGQYTVVLLHRLIAGASKGQVVDIIDGNGLNCTRENLRLCTRAESNMRSEQRRASGTGVRNVRRDKNGYFDARVGLAGKYYKKTFKDLGDAAAWVEATRKKLHGEYAYHKKGCPE